MPFDLTGAGSPAYAAGESGFGQRLTAGRGTLPASPAVLPTNNVFTVAARVTTNATGTRVAISQLDAFWLGVDPNGYAVCHYGAGGTEVTLLDVSGNVTANGSAHHLEVCFDGAGGKLFVDGVLRASSTTTPTAAGMDPDANGLEIGGFQAAGSSFDWRQGSENATIDEVAIFSTVQHTATFTAPTAPYANSAANLLALWHFENNLNDSAGSSPATAVTLSGPSGGVNGVASTNFTVGANGAITGTVTVTPSDSGNGGTFSPTSVNISSGTPTATFTYTPASTGAKSITVTNNGGLTNPSAHTYTVTAGATSFAVDNAAITYSPYNWDTLDVGTYGVSTKSMQTSACGAYLKFRSTGATTVSLTLDPGPNNGFGSNMPRLLVQVNARPPAFIDLVEDATTVQIASGLNPASQNDIQVWLWGTVEGQGNRWGSTPTTSAGNSPTNVLRFNAITTDGGSLAAHPVVRAKRAIFFGDSIVEGVRASGVAADTSAAHGRSAPWFMVPALDAEIGVLGYGGTSWYITGSGSMPGLTTTWNQHANGRARSFSVAPDMVFVMHGYNGPPTGVLTEWLASVRAAVGTSAWIFVVIAPSGQEAIETAAEVDDYIAANPTDDRVVLIDFSDLVPTAGLEDFTGETFQSIDGVHPNERCNAEIGAAIAGLALEAMGGTGELANAVTIGGGLALTSTGRVVSVVG